MEVGVVGVDGEFAQDLVMVEVKSEHGVATILFPCMEVTTAMELQRTVNSATSTTVQVCIHNGALVN
jgi:hypothetical protein